MINDVRYALRTLRQAPGLTGIIVLTLALGIGANTAIFSIVNTLLLDPLPYPHVDRLVAVTFASTDAPLGRPWWPYPKFEAFAKNQRSFDAMAAYGASRLTLMMGDLPTRVEAEVVTASYFPMLGVTAARGRVFRSDEDRVLGEPAVIVLSDRLWRQQFGGDPSLVGKSIVIRSRHYEVIGILPPTFRGQSGTAEAWITTSASEHAVGKGTATGGYSWWMGVIGRLKPAVSLGQAQAEMPAMVRKVDETFLAKMGREEERYLLVPYKALKVNPDVSRSFVLLLGAVGFVLLIACANTANLLLGRAIARQKDFAIRRALGAGRGAIVRQVVVESLLVAVAAGAAGLLVASWTLESVTTAKVANASGFWAEYVRTFQYFDVRLHTPVLLFNFGTAIGVGMLFGLAPAWQAWRAALNDILKYRTGVTSPTFGRSGALSVRGALVLAEIALSLVLLGAAGLMIRSFARAAGTDLGFVPDGIVTMTVAPSARKPPAFYHDLLGRLQALPGVARAALSSGTPLGTGGFISTITIEGRAADAPPLRAMTNYVTPDFAATYGMRLSEGRGLLPEDATGRRVVVVTRAFADRAWPGESALGKRIRTENQFPEVVGVLENATYTTLEDPPAAVVYAPVRHDSLGIGAPNSISLKTTVDEAATVRAVRAALRDVDPVAPVFNVVTMTERAARVTARYRYSAAMMAALAVLALLMAAMGTYGVLAYAVASRTREIGIRVALGASRADVLRTVVGASARLTVGGIALGLAGTIIAARGMRALLFQVSPSDPLTFVVVALVMAAVALAASYVPARRALQLDPVVALRAE